MAQFRFDGEQKLVYPNETVDGAVLVAEPGDTYELPWALDDRWALVSGTPETPPWATENTPDEPVAPAEPAPVAEPTPEPVAAPGPAEEA